MAPSSPCKELHPFDLVDLNVHGLLHGLHSMLSMNLLIAAGYLSGEVGRREL